VKCGSIVDMKMYALVREWYNFWFVDIVKKVAEFYSATFFMTGASWVLFCCPICKTNA
jgi:hypothetical protein